MFSVNVIVIVIVNQPSWSQVEDYDAEDDAEGEGRAVFLRWPLNLKSKLRGWYEVNQEWRCWALMQELREQTRLEEIMAQMEIVQLMTSVLSFIMFVFNMIFLSQSRWYWLPLGENVFWRVRHQGMVQSIHQGVYLNMNGSIVPLSQISMVQRVVTDLQNFFGHSIFRTAMVEAVQKSMLASSAEL